MCETRQFTGLVKFYRNKDYLEKLIDGVMHCNSSEFYRLSKAKGVSDLNESCIFSLRTSRGDRIDEFQINGSQINCDIKSITMRPSLQENKEGYLHCWTLFEFPRTIEELKQLASDLQKLKREFGNSYVFLPIEKLQSFIDRIQEKTKSEMRCGEINYSNNRLKHNVFCKSNKYTYQREYRFVFEYCDNNVKPEEEYCIEGGFNDLLIKNPEIKLKFQDIFISLSKDGVKYGV